MPAASLSLAEALQRTTLGITLQRLHRLSLATRHDPARASKNPAPSNRPETLRLLDRVERVTSDEAVAMARRLIREEGILAAISSGAAVAAAARLAELPPFAENTMVVILPSAAEAYLSSALFAGLFGEEAMHQ
jgi:cysteine synthase